VIFVNIIVLFFGLVIGSFLNVVIYRLPRKLSVVWGRSFCPKCKKKIKWFDNVPLVSYLVLKGHCRSCHSPISFRYPLVELSTGIITVLIFNFKFSIFNQFEIFQLLNFKTIFDIFSYLVLGWGLIAIFFIDLEHQIIPDEIVIPLIIIFTLRFILIGNYRLILVGLVSFLFLFLIYFFTKGKGMGVGDVKLSFLMGLSLGFPKVILAFYIAFLTGAIAGVILILAKKAKLKQKIAFGPFLSLGTIIACIWGENILKILEKLLF